MTYRRKDHPARADKKRWAKVRLAVFDRDGWRCVRCGKAGRLECDHLIPVPDGGAKWDPKNLQTLCRHCHIDKTRTENLDRQPARPGVDAWRKLIDQRMEQT